MTSLTLSCTVRATLNGRKSNLIRVIRFIFIYILNKNVHGHSSIAVLSASLADAQPSVIELEFLETSKYTENDETLYKNDNYQMLNMY